MTYHHIDTLVNSIYQNVLIGSPTSSAPSPPSLNFNETLWKELQEATTTKANAERAVVHFLELFKTYAKSISSSQFIPLCQYFSRILVTGPSHIELDEIWHTMLLDAFEKECLRGMGGVNTVTISSPPPASTTSSVTIAIAPTSSSSSVQQSTTTASAPPSSTYAPVSSSASTGSTTSLSDELSEQVMSILQKTLQIVIQKDSAFRNKFFDFYTKINSKKMNQIIALDAEPFGFTILLNYCKSSPKVFLDKVGQLLLSKEKKHAGFRAIVSDLLFRTVQKRYLNGAHQLEIIAETSCLVSMFTVLLNSKKLEVILPILYTLVLLTPILIKRMSLKTASSTSTPSTQHPFSGLIHGSPAPQPMQQYFSDNNLTNFTNQIFKVIHRMVMGCLIGLQRRKGSAESTAILGTAQSNASVQETQHKILTCKGFRELCQIMYILFPVSFVRYIASQSSQLSATSQQQYHEMVEKLMGDLKFNSRLFFTSVAHSELLHELKLDEWRKVDVDKLLADFQLYKPGIHSNFLPSNASSSGSPLGSQVQLQTSPFSSNIKRVDSSSFIAAYSELEQMFQENTPREVWWQRILSIQNWIELFFKHAEKMQHSSEQQSHSQQQPQSAQSKESLPHFLSTSNISANTFTTEVSNLQKQVLLLRNELLYEKMSRKQLEQQVQRVPKNNVKEWELLSQIDALKVTNKQLTNEINMLQAEIKSWKLAEKESKNRLITWDERMKTQLTAAQETIKRLTEENFNLHESYDLTKHKLEELKQQLNEKSNKIQEMQVRVTENASKLGKLKETDLAMERLKEEVNLWERSHAKWIETAKLNKKLSEGSLFRDKIIEALSLKLELTTEKLRKLSTSLFAKNEIIAQMKKDSEKHSEQIKILKENIEYQQAIAQEQQIALMKKYQSIKELNLHLQQEYTKLKASTTMQTQNTPTAA